MLRRAVLAATILPMLAAAAYAEPIKYTWHGYGINVPGSSKCGSYELNIQLNLEGNRVWGQWQQRTRVVRPFEFTVAADGSFGGQVDLQASIMNVKGSVSGDSVRFDMRGYCVFGGLMKKAE